MAYQIFNYFRNDFLHLTFCNDVFFNQSRSRHQLFNCSFYIKRDGNGYPFISIWFYALDGFDMAETLAVASLSIVIRSLISVAFAGAIYSWLFYKLQLQGLENIAHHLDTVTLSQIR